MAPAWLRRRQPPAPDVVAHVLRRHARDGRDAVQQLLIVDHRAVQHGSGCAIDLLAHDTPDDAVDAVTGAGRDPARTSSGAVR